MTTGRRRDERLRVLIHGVPGSARPPSPGPWPLSSAIPS